MTMPVRLFLALFAASSSLQDCLEALLLSSPQNLRGRGSCGGVPDDGMREGEGQREEMRGTFVCSCLCHVQLFQKIPKDLFKQLQEKQKSELVGTFTFHSDTHNNGTKLCPVRLCISQ